MSSMCYMKISVVNAVICVPYKADVVSKNNVVNGFIIGLLFMKEL